MKECLICCGPMPVGAHASRKTCSNDCAKTRSNQVSNQRKRERNERLAWLTTALAGFRQRVAHRNQKHVQRLNRLQKLGSEPKTELVMDRRGTTYGGTKPKRPADSYIVDPPADWI